MKRLLGWHFLQASRRLNFEDNRLVRCGQTLMHQGELTMCVAGLHACPRIMDALRYAPGPIVERVELSGEILRHTGKAVAHRRKCLWWLDATYILHEFACRCAEDALKLVKSPDARSIEAIRVKRLWLKGCATEAELKTAGAAAWAAAMAGRVSNAAAAAWTAAMAGRPFDAAAAAWATSANARTRDANARASAWAGDWDVQNRRLTAMVMAAHKQGGRK